MPKQMRTLAACPWAFHFPCCSDRNWRTRKRKKAPDLTADWLLFRFDFASLFSLLPLALQRANTELHRSAAARLHYVSSLLYTRTHACTLYRHSFRSSYLLPSHVLISLHTLYSPHAARPFVTPLAPGSGSRAGSGPRRSRCCTAGRASCGPATRRCTPRGTGGSTAAPVALLRSIGGRKRSLDERESRWCHQLSRAQTASKGLQGLKQAETSTHRPRPRSPRSRPGTTGRLRAPPPSASLLP